MAEGTSRQANYLRARHTDVHVHVHVHFLLSWYTQNSARMDILHVVKENLVTERMIEGVTVI